MPINYTIVGKILESPFAQIKEEEKTNFHENSFPHNSVSIFQSQRNELEDWTTFNTAKNEAREKKIVIFI